NDEKANSLRAFGRKVFRTDLADFGVTRVPTVLRLSGNGTVQSSWTGSVPHDRHDEIFASLISGESVQSYRRIPESDLSSYVATHRTQVVAFSKLGQDPAIPSTIIPPAEFYIRVKHELDPGLPILVDCGSTL